MNIRKIFLPAVAIVLPLTCTTIAHAGGLYIGASLMAEDFVVDYDKTTINRQNPPRADNTFHSDDSSDKPMYGFGVLVGYRKPLGESGLYFGGELDFTHHNGTVHGYLPEAGNAPGRNEYGESWSQKLSYEKERSYGLTLKLGMPAEIWMGDGASLYALAGVRRADTRIGLGFEGCETAVACDSLGLVSDGLERDVTVTGWTAGLGFEKMLNNKHTAFRAEFRLTNYENDRWTSFPATPALDKLRIPAAIDSDALVEFGLFLGLVQYR